MKRGTVVGIIAGAAVLAMGAGLAVWAFSRPPSPEAAAETYLRALSDGDFDTIEGLLDHDDSADHDALRQTFEGASGYITEYDFAVMDDSSGMKGVRAEVELGGEPGVVHFALAESGGRWRLAADYLGAVEATTTLGGSVRIGGRVELAGTRISVLPAVYPVQAAPVGILTGGEDVVVTNEEPVAVAIEASLSPQATVLAQEQLDIHAQECAAPATEVPANCGLRVPWAADLAALDGIRFRIEQLPVLSLAPDGRTFAATGGVIVATATGTTREGGAASVTYRADDWALRGTIRFAGDEMVLRVG